MDSQRVCVSRRQNIAQSEAVGATLGIATIKESKPVKRATDDYSLALSSSGADLLGF